MKSSSPYNTFAQYYDRVVGDRSEVAGYYMRLIKAHAPHAQSVLELGCGTGTMLSYLTQRFETTGVDNSTSMLRLAQRKAPKASLKRGDIRKVALGRKFDLVVCPFDTMNHISSRTGWREVFHVVRQHLKPGGTFLFDMNTRRKMLRYCDEPVEVCFHGQAFSMVSARRSRGDLYEVRLAYFEPKRASTFRRHEMRIRELILPPGEVRSMLLRLFAQVDVIDPEHGVVSAQSEELFLIAR